jgi:hypothetical protein
MARKSTAPIAKRISFTGRVPGMDLYSLRCSNANTNYNPVTNSYIGYDGIQRYCRP